MNRRITIRDIARAAGVHLSTAARALKNDPRISEPTRRRIAGAARELGYVPDPMMSAFAEYRKRTRASAFQGTIAWVTNHPRRDDWRNATTDLYYAGALERCREIGYNLETFWLRENGMTSARASAVLSARGIRGLILAPQHADRGHVRLQWDKFAAVAIGYSIIRPKLNLVATAHFEAGVVCVRRLRSMGYRRIGMAIWSSANERSAHFWTGAFHTEIRIVPESAGIPIYAPRNFDRDSFHAWFKAHRPEAIITVNDPVVQWLRELGYSVPGEVGVAVLNINPGWKGLAGAVELSEPIGRSAVDVLAGMLQRGEYGLPAVPTRVLVDPEWVDGPTLRPLRTAGRV